MGPEPTFPRTLHRFPLKNSFLPGCQSCNDESKNGGCRAEQALASLLPAGPLLQLVPRPRRKAPQQGAPPAPQSWSDTHKQEACIPSVSTPETRGEHGAVPRDTRQARTTVSPAPRKEEETLRKTVSGREPAKDGSRGRDTSPLRPHAEPSEPCCHSTLQPTPRRKSEGAAPTPSGVCSPERLR